MKGDKMREEYEYGMPIPEKYRNRLFDWKGGGYDGCFWEMNQGVVTIDGHWVPIYSSGCDGIDDGGWYDKKIDQLKAELGYDIRHPEVQLHEAQRKAVEAVFGEEWYMLEGTGFFDDPRVKEMTKKDDERYAEFCRRKKEYLEERTHRLDDAFMESLKREREDERPAEVGLLDKGHVKETCRAFCDAYERNVGMMTHVLDKLEEMGYDVWCTCTDCKEQFQSMEVDTFRCCIDDDAYKGDGGIGVIMTRVLCDDCREATSCPVCRDYDLPNPNKPDHGEKDMEMYDFLASVMYDWIGVCWGCSDGYLRDELEIYSASEGKWVWRKSSAGEKFEEIEESLKEHYQLEGHELYDEMKKTLAGRKRINDIRDLLQDSVAKHFEEEGYDPDCTSRLDVYEPEQQELKL